MPPMLPTRFIVIRRVAWNGKDLPASWDILKGGLDKLEIEPEIFYAGKFKSATEPLRAEKMSDANRLQLNEMLSEIFNHILDQTAKTRGQDSAVLRRCVDEQLIQTASDAVTYKLVDGLKYNDEVLQEIAGKIKATSITRINFVPMGKYYEAVKSKLKGSGSDRIAIDLCGRGYCRRKKQPEGNRPGYLPSDHP